MSPRLGRRVATLNRSFTNHLTRPLAQRLPGMGVLVHTGRRSKRQYRTPVNAFRTMEGYVIALTYGVETDWLQNVLAAGGCEFITRGRHIRLSGPEIVHDEHQSLVPRPVRPMLRLMRATDFLRLHAAESDAE